MTKTANNGGKGPSCARCQYAVKSQLVGPNGEITIGQYQLNCKRFPPQVVVTMIQGPQGAGMMHPPSVTFPPVVAEVWCHEWKEGEPQEDLMGPLDPANDSTRE